MIDNQLLTKTEIYCSNILQQFSAELSCHQLNYTQRLVDDVETIGAATSLSADDLILAKIAAWFLYTGMQEDYENYLLKSQDNARAFLRAEGLPEDKMTELLQAMSAAAGTAKAKSPIANVLADAAKNYLTEDHYKAHMMALRAELAAKNNKTYTDVAWNEEETILLSKMNFYTPYGKEVLEAVRQERKRKLEKQKEKWEKEVDNSLQNTLGVSAAELKELKKKLKKAEGRPERGIETMFRLTSKNHLDLSGMADNKANIMISVNSIILSILIGGLLPKLDTNTHLVIPTIILLLVNLTSMICSIISIRPTITNGLFTREDIENQRTNLLFFGNFHKMSREDYHWGMNKLMDNAHFLYSSLIDDIYFLGVVLAKKYRFLRYSYNIFMIGIVIAVVAFLLANYMAEQPLTNTLQLPLEGD